MKYVVVNCAQRSPEWYAARLGRLTGSRAHDAFARNKPKKQGELGEWSRARLQLRVQLALERITRMSGDDPYLGADMKRGIELEPDARRRYEAATGSLLATTGFLQHPGLPTGCSLDAHIGRMTGIAEFKCPRMANHWDNLRARAIPTEYREQVLHGLWITGAEWCDFVSFCPQFPASLQLCIRRVERAAVDLARYERDVRQFLAEVDLEEAAIRTMADTASVLQKIVA